MRRKLEPEVVRGIFGMICCGCKEWAEHLIRVALSRYRCSKCAGRP